MQDQQEFRKHRTRYAAIAMNSPGLAQHPASDVINLPPAPVQANAAPSAASQVRVFRTLQGEAPGSLEALAAATQGLSPQLAALNNLAAIPRVLSPQQRAAVNTGL